MNLAARRSLGRLASASTALLLGAGCGAEATTPHEEPGALASIVILPATDESVTLTLGETRVLSVGGRDEGGTPRPVDPAAVEWTSRHPDVADTDANGRITASELGLAWVVASTEQGFVDSMAVWVQRPESESSSFRISLIFSEEVDATWREVMRIAAERWERVIRAELPEVELASDGSECPKPPPGEPPVPAMSGPERGVRIFVNTSGSFDVNGSAIAVGGQCLSRGLPHPTTLIGAVTLNRFRIVDMSAERRARLAVHEMGHALGLAATSLPLPPSVGDPFGGAYHGIMGREGYRKSYGAYPSSPAFVDAGGHWSVPGDVMNPFSEPRIAPLSVGALMDLGYPAAWYGAGDFLDDFPQH